MKRTILAAALAALPALAAADPLPGMRGVDHIGLTVPDLAEAETFFGGMRAIFATMFWISSTSTMRGRVLSGCNRQFAPASSMTSIALSGKWRSLMCFAESSAAARSASSE